MPANALARVRQSRAGSKSSELSLRASTRWDGEDMDGERGSKEGEKRSEAERMKDGKSG